MTTAMVSSPRGGIDANAGRPLVVPLASALDETLVGAKAANLARLHLLGHDVPDAFVITDEALRLFLEEADLQPAMDTLCAKLDVRSPSGLGAAAETIAALIRQSPLPLQVQSAIDDHAARLGDDTLIVRSSAVGEDSHGASFAGQLDSIGGVRGSDFLRVALHDVWASRWSARSLAYQLARRTPLAGMGVIVQRQIASRVSGVLFTIAPDDQGSMLIEYCEGMGEALVSGRENPGRVVVDRRLGHWEHRAALEERSLASFPADESVRSLTGTALAIEQSFGGPQDIEWTMDGAGRIWIVQARPVTVASRSSGSADCVQWSNANVNENFPAPISPLLYSVAGPGYYHYFRNLGRAFGIAPWRLAAMERPLRQIVGVQAGRLYYNLTSIHGVLRSAPFGELLTAAFNQFVGAGGTASPAAAGRFGSGRERIRQAFELARVAWRTTWQYAFLTRRVVTFERTVDDYARRTAPDALRNRPLPELVDDLRGFIDIRNNKWIGASLADAAAMVTYGALQRLLARARPSDDQHALQNSLLKALPGLVSSMPAIELWKLSRLVRSDPRLRALFDQPSDHVLDGIARDARFVSFRDELQHFLDDWGFRCSGELMLTVPSFQEEPSRAIDLVRTYAAMDGDSPVDIIHRQEQARLQDTARLARILRSRRLVIHAGLAVGPVLRATQASILLRERARLKQALLYSRLRRVALAIGDRFVQMGHLADREDVFHLTVEEIQTLGDGTAMFPFQVEELVALRQKAHAEVEAAIPPDTLSLLRGAYWGVRPGSDPGQSRVTPGSDRGQTGVRPQEELRGTSACGGTVTARAAVLRDVGEADRLQPGDVLVTRQTDPGWAPIFPLVSGLVIERGGMLSHGAIIAREFGLPSIVGVAEATTRIPHGSRVHVDADRGVVRVIE